MWPRGETGRRSRLKICYLETGVPVRLRPGPPFLFFPPKFYTAGSNLILKNKAALRLGRLRPGPPFYSSCHPRQGRHSRPQIRDPAQGRGAASQTKNIPPTAKLARSHKDTKGFAPQRSQSFLNSYYPPPPPPRGKVRMGGGTQHSP